MKTNKNIEEKYKCQSYYDDTNTLRDCSCGKCGRNLKKMEEVVKKIVGELTYGGYGAYLDDTLPIERAIDKITQALHQAIEEGYRAGREEFDAGETFCPCHQTPKKDNWEERFKQEFGTHFSSSELQFALVFIEEEIEQALAERDKVKVKKVESILSEYTYHAGSWHLESCDFPRIDHAICICDSSKIRLNIKALLTPRE